MNSTYKYLIRGALTLILSFCFGICIESVSFGDERIQVKVEASRPPEKGCAWQKLDSAHPKISLVFQECDYGFRKITHALQGNAIVQRFSDSPKGSAPDKVIEIFSKNVGDSPAQALKKLFINRLNPYEQQHCVVEETKSKELLQSPFGDSTKSAWIIAPDKTYQAKIAKETAEGDMPEQTCGQYGLPVDSRAYFEFHTGNKEEFAWVMVGQDTPLFDEQSLGF